MIVERVDDDRTYHRPYRGSVEPRWRAIGVSTRTSLLSGVATSGRLVLFSKRTMLMKLSHIVEVYGPSVYQLGNPDVIWEDSNGENANITCQPFKDETGKWKFIIRPLEEDEDQPPDFARG